jgi:hypothetical protein
MMTAPSLNLITIPANFRSGPGHVIVSRATLDAWQGGGLILILLPLARNLAVVVPVVRKEFDLLGCDTTIIYFEGRPISVFIPPWRYTP